MIFSTRNLFKLKLRISLGTECPNDGSWVKNCNAISKPNRIIQHIYLDVGTYHFVKKYNWFCIDKLFFKFRMISTKQTKKCCTNSGPFEHMEIIMFVRLCVSIIILNLCCYKIFQNGNCQTCISLATLLLKRSHSPSFIFSLVWVPLKTALPSNMPESSFEGQGPQRGCQTVK